MIGLGILLGVAALAVVGTVFWKMSQKPPATAAAGLEKGGAQAASTGAAAFGIANLPIPVTCQVKTISIAGDRLVVLVEGPDDCSRALVADLRTGKLLGQFLFAGQ